MVTTYIDTTQCPRRELPGRQGEVAEIVDKNLCGAENVVGMLRWLGEGERFETESLGDRHQLIYFMEGDGVLTLENKKYPVSKGSGIYLGPSETAGIAQAGIAPVMLFHLIVRKEGKNAL
ncbi:MAG: hypothetical protein HY695_38525 [Deltaproteobacteria bacterium]|nr:hypothetical protein [Deltaproteobacteria bacterium]